MKATKGYSSKPIVNFVNTIPEDALKHDEDFSLDLGFIPKCDQGGLDALVKHRVQGLIESDLPEGNFDIHLEVSYSGNSLIEGTYHAHIKQN